MSSYLGDRWRTINGATVLVPLTPPLPPHDPPTMTGLCTTAKRLLLAVVVHTRRTGLPPTRRDLQRACGISSTSVVTYHLDRLTRRGLLVHAPSESRAYRLPQKEPAVPPPSTLYEPTTTDGKTPASILPGYRRIAFHREGGQTTFIRAYDMEASGFSRFAMPLAPLALRCDGPAPSNDGWEL